MARVGSKDTRPEMMLRRQLWAAGLRYRVHHRVEGVRPDLIIPSAKVAVFVDGCFWHGCPQHYAPPRVRLLFWADKLRANVERDVRQSCLLASAGWRVLRFWEHEISGDLGAPVASVVDVSHGAETMRSPWRIRAAEAEALDGQERHELVSIFGDEDARIVVGPRNRALSRKGQRRRA